MLLRYCLSDFIMVPVAPSSFYLILRFYIPDALYFYLRVLIIVIIIIIIIITAVCVMQQRPPAQQPINFLATSSYRVSKAHNSTYQYFLPIIPANNLFPIIFPFVLQAHSFSEVLEGTV